MALFVYMACRREGPRMVLQTGVADGIATFIIQEALGANCLGTSRSVDVRGDVGELVNMHERSRWRLYVLQGDRRGALTCVFGEVRRGKPFFHDSNYFYHWQTTRLRAATWWVLPGALLLADNVDTSRGSVHWCRNQEQALELCLARTLIFRATRVRVSETRRERCGIDVGPRARCPRTSRCPGGATK